MVLDEQFIQKCREAFNTFDQDRGGRAESDDDSENNENRVIVLY